MAISVCVLTGTPVAVSVTSLDPIVVSVAAPSAISVSADVAGGEINTGSSLGAGEAVFAGKLAQDLTFKSLVAGTNVTLASDANEITIDSPDVSGETNTASNVGAGSGVFKQKTGFDLEFKSLIGGTNLTLTDAADTITFDVVDTGDAPDDASYVTIALNGTLTSERVLTGGDGITLTDGGANGNATLDLDIFSLAGAAVVAADLIPFHDNSSGGPKQLAFSSFEGTINHDALQNTHNLTTDIDHDALTNFVADEHVAHSSVTLTAGIGLTGGGTIAANRTFDLDINGLVTDGIVSADQLVFYDASGVDHNKISFSAFQATLNHDSLAGFLSNEHINHNSVDIIAGAGMTGGGNITIDRTLNVIATTDGGLLVNANDIELNFGLATVTAVSGDFLLLSDTSDAGNVRKVDASDFLSGGGAPTNASYVTIGLDGTLTDERVLTAGSGLTLTDGGANGNATLAVLGKGIREFTTTTTDATLTTIGSLSIATDNAEAYSIRGLGQEDATGDVKSNRLDGLIRNDSGTTDLVGENFEIEHATAGASTWAITAVANNGTNSLDIKVQGAVGRTIQWRVHYQSTEE